MFQTSAKSLSNLESCDFFVKIWKKSRHVRTGCFLSKFRFYSDLRQISKYSNLSHTFSCIRRTIPTIHLLTSYFPGHLCESESRYSSRAVSLVQFSPKYPSTCWKWKVGTNLERFWWKTFTERNEERPFQIVAKFVPNKKFGRRNLDIWTDRRFTAGTHYHIFRVLPPELPKFTYYNM